MLAAAFATAAILAACGGSDGSTGATGPTGPQGPAGTDATTVVKANQLSADGWANLSLAATVSSVTINSAPVVVFKVTDANGNPVTGLAVKNAAGAYKNFMFAMAKLMPGDSTLGRPSRWVSYHPFQSPPVSGQPAKPFFPEYENTGTMTDNGDGTYTYTFATDITKAQSFADSATYNATHLRSDLDDLTYVPTLTHRLIISIGGYQTGTTNLAGASANVAYDFIPATGRPVTASDPSRDIVAMASCNECHGKLAMHESFFPPISDPKLCVVCHTEQVKFGSGDSLPSSGNMLVPNGDFGAFGATMRLMDRALPNFPNMVHKIHAGEKLYYQGYNQFGVKYNHTKYPQPVANCTKCHDGSESARNKTAQGDNWMTKPSRLACGSCHDGINFASGTGVGINGGTTGHFNNRGQADDSICGLCHTPANLKSVHITVDPTGANGRGGYPLNTALNVPTPGFPAGQGPSIALASLLNPPAGLYKIGLEMSKVTVAGAPGAKKATVVYRILKDGQPVTLNPTGFLIDQVDGSPNIMIAYAQAEDGIATPADWTGPANAIFGGVSVKDIRDGKVGTQTGPDASGWYTATLSAVIPDDARLVTAAFGVGYNGFVQLNLPAYPNGIRLRESAFVIKTADGYTARRQVVDNGKCINCHGQLGVEPSFHAGARNNGEGCALCHQPGRTTGHVGAANNFGGGWSVSAKNLVHGIHGGKKRAQAYTYEATADNPTGFAEVTYPGVLRNCEQCHVPGSYDFSRAVNAAAQPMLLWTTEAKYDMSNPTSAPSIGLSPWITTLGRGQVSYVSDNLVSSPVASSCFGCHDSSAAIGHMKANGGSVYATVSTLSVSGTGDRSKGFLPVEQCMICHGADKVADIKTVHRVGK